MSGVDDKGSVYSSIDEMWKVELHNHPTTSKVNQKVGSKQQWYQTANQYWSKAQPSYNGVLGGFGNLSGIDIRFSLSFILSLIKIRPEFKRGTVLDCGAGVGRISNELLCQTFKTVDVVDQCQKLVAKARELLKQKKSVRHFFVKGLQQFEFIDQYDCIWIQWVFSQLNDEDAVAFLLKAKAALAPGGVIILKQNHCKSGFAVDKQDCSVTRSAELYKCLFEKALLKVVKQEGQKDWPQDLFVVRMYALA